MINNEKNIYNFCTHLQWSVVQMPKQLVVRFQCWRHLNLWNQITFTIGETFGASLGGSSAIVTQGFQQPGERVRTWSVFPYVQNSFKPYTATDIGGPILTAQLSNAAGSFTSPINIGTLSGNASIAVIDGFLM
jgi:hypothetical protein